jgi:hypothetical protein
MCRIIFLSYLLLLKRITIIVFELDSSCRCLPPPHPSDSPPPSLPPTAGSLSPPAASNLTDAIPLRQPKTLTWPINPPPSEATTPPPSLRAARTTPDLRHRAPPRSATFGAAAGPAHDRSRPCRGHAVAHKKFVFENYHCHPAASVKAAWTHATPPVCCQNGLGSYIRVKTVRKPLSSFSLV